MQLFTYCKKLFNKVSINSLRFVVGHLGPPTIGLTFKSFGSQILLNSEQRKHFLRAP